MSAFESLKRLATEAAIVSSSASVLGWDQETYLPEQAHDWRARQLSWLAGRSHELSTSKELGDALKAALDETDSSDERTLGNLREMQRRFDRSTKLPASLVEKNSEISSRSKHAWATARKTSDFSLFAPHLQSVLDISREKAELWGYQDEPYDALIETYERGATTASVSRIFDELGPDLRNIAAAAVARTEAKPAKLPEGPYPIDQQMSFNEKVARSFGFDFDRGRIDTTTHPFCTTLGPDDIRLTTRYEVSDFTSSLLGVLHEAGHGLYEQGLRAGDFGQAAGDSVSLGIHESQSRLWENHVGRSREFWAHWLPVAAEHFPQLKNTDLNDFLAYIHRAEFSFIRVESDEATYDLHILLRFELERRLMRDEMKVADVPAAWNEAFEKSFGLIPPDDAHGCLQDIHWSMGGLGYFPTYTLGNLNAAQLFAASMRDGSIRSAFSKADYAPLLQWLRAKVHDHGATLEPSEIVKRATGSEPNARAHLNHLRERYNR
ncbi:carboxypeptidase M32 [Haloferula chungangensis]|uniref:Metal-dependent carboxypeptidase n=1 Tax=Haloferula chungangensis TaxID=1048331 RepID=A0ABW2L0N7_9BACT